MMDNYLKERRIQLDLTQKEVADKVGVSEATISRWEGGQIANMKRQYIAAYADALRTTPSFIMTGKEGEEKEHTPSLPTGAIPVRPGPMIPVLGEVRCGRPMYAEENISGYISYQGISGDQYFALRAVGDSMNAAGICDGDTVIVRQQDAVDPGTIAVVCVNGDEATLKRFRQEGDTVFLSPQSYDPRYQVQVYDLKKTPVHIMGRVMEVRKTF